MGYFLILDHQAFVVLLPPSFTGQRGEVVQGRSVCSAGLSTEPPVCDVSGTALCSTTVVLQ